MGVVLVTNDKGDGVRFGKISKMKSEVLELSFAGMETRIETSSKLWSEIGLTEPILDISDFCF